MKTLFRRLISRLGDKYYNIINFYYLHLRRGVLPYCLNIKNPATFNEKIIYLKTNVKYSNSHVYADKLKVRNFVKQVSAGKYLVPLLGVWESSKDINYKELPNKFVLKTNHGSGMNIVCMDKKLLNIKRINQKLEKWIKTNYFDIGREYQYKDIKPRILAEKMLVTKGGKEPNDYKFFCFNGTPKFIQVDIDRHTNHTRSFYDINWNHLPFTILYPPYTGELVKPEMLSEMLDLAEKLSQRFIFARIDLYSIERNIYFGEITFHPEGGFGPILPREFDLLLGGYLKLEGRK
jgi:hypothetical protein